MVQLCAKDTVILEELRHRWLILHNDILKEIKMNIRRMQRAIVILLIPLALAGCASAENKQYGGQTSASGDRTAQTVRVETGDIVPTRSLKAQVGAGVDFAVLATKVGVFVPSVESGQRVEQGTVLGSVEDRQLVSPVGATVVSVIAARTTVPANYPVVTLRFDGFGLTGDLSNLVATVGNAPFAGKFQVTDGVGPTDCSGVVPLASDASSGAEGQSSTISISDSYACLIPTDSLVRAGQSAILVVTAQARNDVALLPVTAVAGRLQKGQVRRPDGTVLNVGLGATDGARIEITSGLKAGDAVSATPPDLDPQSK